jgi:hypothetical protein
MPTSSFSDGVFLMDPNNSNIKPNLLQPQNLVRVGVLTPQLWEVAEVPHGVIISSSRL